MADKLSDLVPINPDISRANYVELISIELVTKMSVCNDPVRTVESSIPRIIDQNYQMACDSASISRPSIDKLTTNVQNITANLDLANIESTPLGLRSVNSFLGSDITQYDVAASVSDAPTTPSIPDGIRKRSAIRLSGLRWLRPKLYLMKPPTCLSTPSRF